MKYIFIVLVMISIGVCGIIGYGYIMAEKTVTYYCNKKQLNYIVEYKRKCTDRFNVTLMDVLNGYGIMNNKEIVFVKGSDEYNDIVEKIMVKFPTLNDFEFNAKITREGGKNKASIIVMEFHEVILYID